MRRALLIRSELVLKMIIPNTEGKLLDRIEKPDRVRRMLHVYKYTLYVGHSLCNRNSASVTERIWYEIFSADCYEITRVLLLPGI